MGALLYRGVQAPDSFALMVEWDSVEAHTFLTQRSEFGSFRKAIGPYLAGRTGVRHVESVA